MSRICPTCEFRGDERVCPHDGHPMVNIAQYDEEEAQALIGRTFEDRYKIQELLGKGGMGWVFAAEHLKTGQNVALKVLRKGANAKLDRVKRFYAEARISSGLTHPHIVKVFDFGASDDGYLFIAMELLHGQSLADLLAQHGSIDPFTTARIVYQVCQALGAAHAEGLVHRDLKPDNIFLCDVHGTDLFVKVLDFGIAKAIEEAEENSLTPLTATGATVGTPMYMSPEQASLQPLDGRSDLYALGVITYEMLVGKIPFDSRGAVQVMMAHVNEIPPPLPAQFEGETIPAPMRHLVSELLAKRPQDRPDSPLDVAGRLEDYVRGEGPISPSLLAEQAQTATAEQVPTPAASHTIPHRTAPPPRRRAGIGLGVFMALALIAGLVVLLTGQQPNESKPGARSVSPPSAPSPSPAITIPQAPVPEKVSEPKLVPVEEDVMEVKPAPEPAMPATSGKRTYLKRVKEQMSSIRRCAKRHLKDVPAGTVLKLTLQLVIDKEGNVTQTGVRQRKGGNAAFARCAKAQLRKLRFPKSPGVITLNLPANLVMTER